MSVYSSSSTAADHRQNAELTNKQIRQDTCIELIDDGKYIITILSKERMWRKVDASSREGLQSFQSELLASVPICKLIKE